MSTFDRRRINGPEKTHPIQYAPSPLSQQPQAQKPNELFLQTGIVPQANGSAYIEQGSQKLIVSVYGPRQIRSSTYNAKAKLNVDVRLAPFSSTRRKEWIKDVHDPTFSNSLTCALVPGLRLEALPKSTVDVFVTVLQAEEGLNYGEYDEQGDVGGCVIGAAATAASAALTDAGIEMNGLIIGLAATRKGTSINLNPTSSRWSDADGRLLMFILPALGTTTSVEASGSWPTDLLDQAMTNLEELSTTVHGLVAQHLSSSFAKEKQ